MLTLYEIADYIGVATFAWMAAAKALKKQNSLLVGFVCVFLTTFGGGAFIRDLLLYHIRPAVLTNYTQVTFSVMIYIAYYFLAYKKTHFINLHETTLTPLYTLLDGIGCGAFIVGGIERGLANSIAPFRVILGGVFTAIGGGILAALYYGIIVIDANKNDLMHYRKMKIIYDVFSESALYRAFMVIMSILYYLLRTTGMDFSKSSMTLIFIAMTSCSLLDLTVIRYLKERVESILINGTVLLLPYQCAWVLICKVIIMMAYSHKVLPDAINTATV